MEPLKLKITATLHAELGKQLAQILRKTALGKEQIPLPEIMAFDADYKAARKMCGYYYLYINTTQSLKAASYVLRHTIFLISNLPAPRTLLVNHANSILTTVNVLLEA